MTIKESLFKGITKSAFQKMQMEYVMSNILNNSTPYFVWIREDVEKQLAQFGLSLDEYKLWLKEKNKTPVRLIFKK